MSKSTGHGTSFDQNGYATVLSTGVARKFYAENADERTGNRLRQRLSCDYVTELETASDENPSPTHEVEYLIYQKNYRVHEVASLGEPMRPLPSARPLQGF